MTAAGTLSLLTSLVQGLVVVGTLVVVGKAAVAYRQHDSRPMALLAAGLFLVLIAPPAFEALVGALLDGTPLTGPVGGDRSPTAATLWGFFLVEELIRLAGVAALLGSLYVRE
ncbi:hypothetical protein [Halosimplex pelagicum]|uniref:Uncharacterized protein n=1 Tax=Halosimplex pelagicum TaxID=869886 RepID=A0A7D5P9Y2_9EURY|nr:hypothetical protein [Halosimplex pelagicum]QLH81102.1 hypothetical protein HZS54_05375 [Halosimplex pelagicum]